MPASSEESPRLKMAASLTLKQSAQEVAVAQTTPMPKEGLPTLAPSPAAVAPPVPEPSAPAQALRITLSDAQPLLVRLIDSVKSGQAQALVQWIDADWRTNAATGKFRTHYDRMLDGRQVAQLGQVSFESSAADGELQVDGTIELDLRDAANRTEKRQLHLRVYFQEKDGQPVLTRLVAGHLR